MTKWTIPERLRAYAHLEHAGSDWGFSGEGEAINSAADRIEALEAALREILREAPSLQYAQQIARDALNPKEGKP